MRAKRWQVCAWPWELATPPAQERPSSSTLREPQCCLDLFRRRFIEQKCGEIVKSDHLRDDLVDFDRAAAKHGNCLLHCKRVDIGSDQTQLFAIELVGLDRDLGTYWGNTKE